VSILVTGGAGYVGSHTVMELLNCGEDVIVLDNLEKGHKEAILTEKFYQVDLREINDLERVFKENNIEAVIHFAANSLVFESILDPIKYYYNNVTGMQNLLSTMRKFNVNKIIFSSSAAVYGNPTEIPIKEDSIKNPINPYGETKLVMENMMKWCDSAYGIKFVALRYFNAAGAHESGRIGEDHNPETHLIPIVLQTALGLREQVTIYGDKYDTEDGTCVRDYIHVTDLAMAHVLALKYLRENDNSNIFNLGCGSGYSVKQIIDTAKKVTGIDIKTVIGENRAGDPPTLIASSEKARKILGWNPKFDDVEKIIVSAWNWHKKLYESKGGK
jgi:UDP-glucose 4-epimerase